MSEENLISLAPAAGAGIGKQVAERLLARADFLPLMEEAAVAGLQANLPPRWDPAAKEWAPAVPDAKTRVQTWLGILAQMEGDPVKRIIHQHIGAGKAIDPVSVLQESPALMEAAARAVANAAHKSRKGKRAPEKPAELVGDDAEKV